MLKIRLQRVGRKHDPSYRVVITDSKNGPQSGKFLEILGTYDPRIDKAVLKEDRIKYWISTGAQVSETLHNVLVNNKIIDAKKINVLPKKSPILKEKKEKAPADEEAKEETPASTDETAPAEEAKEESPVEEPVVEEKVEEAPTEEKKEEASA